MTGRGDGPAAEIPLHRQLFFASVIVAATLLLIEGAARIWLRHSARPLATLGVDPPMNAPSASRNRSRSGGFSSAG